MIPSVYAREQQGFREEVGEGDNARFMVILPLPTRNDRSTERMGYARVENGWDTRSVKFTAAEGFKRGGDNKKKEMFQGHTRQHQGRILLRAQKKRGAIWGGRSPEHGEKKKY